jgi:hypothetical protein
LLKPNHADISDISMPIDINILTKLYKENISRIKNEIKVLFGKKLIAMSKSDLYLEIDKYQDRLININELKNYLLKNEI